MKSNRLLTLFLMLLMTVGVMAQEEITVKTFKELSTDLTARTQRRYDLNQDACALVKVLFPNEGARFEGNVVGDVEYRGSEYWVYLVNGTKSIRLMLPGYPTIEVEFVDYGVTQVVSNVTYAMDFKFPSKGGMQTSFYAEAGFLAGSPMGVGLSVGAYLGGFNVELAAQLPIASAQRGWWQSDVQAPLEFEYKPSLAFGGRLGYGIQVGEKLRITPQLGMMLMTFSESAVSTTTLTPAKGANCASATLGVKLQYLLGQHFGISLTPQYAVPVAKSKGFQSLADGCEAIGKWNNGIGVKLSLGVVF